MKLIISDDGKVISGTATSKSANWSGTIEFKRMHLENPIPQTCEPILFENRA
jgi:hypothetical protein